MQISGRLLLQVSLLKTNLITSSFNHLIEVIFHCCIIFLFLYSLLDIVGLLESWKLHRFSKKCQKYVCIFLISIWVWRYQMTIAIKPNIIVRLKIFFLIKVSYLKYFRRITLHVIKFSKEYCRFFKGFCALMD